MPVRASLNLVLKTLPPGTSFEESCRLMPYAVSWLQKEKARLEAMYDFQESFGKLAAGCDEVGRGPLAGPLAAAAVLLPGRPWIPGLNDSKKLTAENRTILERWIKKTAASWAVCEISLEEMHDINNIASASVQAMSRALGALTPQPEHVLADGTGALPWEGPQTSLIKGDGRVPAIAAASILAKVYRDKLLDDAAVLWPAYDFGNNKGYGTAAHMSALRSLGPCPYHRQDYAPVASLWNKLDKNQPEVPKHLSFSHIECGTNSNVL